MDLKYSGTARTAIVRKNILGSICLKAISMLVSYALVPLTLGFLSSELYGVWLTISTILVWLGFLDLGFSQGLKNKLIEAIAKEDWYLGKSLVSSCYFVMFIIFVPSCFLFEMLIPNVNWANFLNVSVKYNLEITKAIQLLVLFACIQMIVNVITSVVAAFQKVALASSFSVLGNVLSLLLIYFLVKVSHPSLVNLSIAFASMPIGVMSVATFLLFRGKYRKIAPSIRHITKSHLLSLLSLGYKIFIVNVQVVVLYQGTNFLISTLSSPNEVTTYNIAYKLMNFSMLLYTIIINPLWPAYADAYAKNDYKWMKLTRKRMIKILYLSIFGCCLISFIAPWIYKLWIGNAVHIPPTMTYLVALYVVIYCWVNLNSTLLIGMGKIKMSTIISVFGLLIHIPLSVFCASYFGAYGVIFSLILINLIYAVVEHFQVNIILNKKAFGVWLK